MANWADVEFRNTPKYRRMQNVVSLAADLLMLWDFLVSLSCGEGASRFWPAVGVTARSIAGEDHAKFLTGVVIGSLTLALTLRSATGLKRNSPVLESSFFVASRHRTACVVAAFVAAAFAAQIGHRSAQIWIVAWLLLLAPIHIASRWGFAIWLEKLESLGALREAVAIVGAPGARERLAVRIASGADIVGLYEMPSDQSHVLPPSEIETLREMGAGGRVDSVVFAVEAEHPSDISKIVERLKMLPIQLAICGEGERPAVATADFRILAGVPIRVFAKRPINRRDLLIKTTFDRVSAAILIIVLMPLMVFISGLIIFESRGPVIFRQTRQGWCNRQFTVFKFRTMQDAPQTCGGYTQTKRNDPRCTGIGRLLRSLSLDELPQLWNVVLGDMSLVGPRPHAEMLDEDDRGGREIVAEYALRYRVRPGITGWAQIHGARGATSTVEQLRRRVALDLYYIEHWSLWLDLRILARTPFCMAGKNAF